MRILARRIKRWNFKQRLFEMQKRLLQIQESSVLEGNDAVDLDETLKIIDYWMHHMAGEVVATEEKPKKKIKKSVNVFE